MIGLISCIADVATVIAVLIAAYQLYSDRKIARKVATLDAYDKLQKDSFDVLNKWMPNEISDACENKQSDAYKELSSALARIEFFCAGIIHNVYDIDIFYDMAHGYFDEGGTLYRRMIPLLESKLQTADKDYFENIHNVLFKMKKKTNL